MSEYQSELVRELYIQIKQLERENADLKRQNAELRGAVAALMDPTSVKFSDTLGVSPQEGAVQGVASRGRPAQRTSRNSSG
jgi:hypothetical protein